MGGGWRWRGWLRARAMPDFESSMISAGSTQDEVLKTGV